MAWINKRKPVRRSEGNRAVNPYLHMYKDVRWWNSHRTGLSQVHRTENPLCCECEKHGVIVPAEEVDHIKPHKGDWALFLDPTNLQSLCTRCHSRKTVRENAR